MHGIKFLVVIASLYVNEAVPASTTAIGLG